MNDDLENLIMKLNKRIYIELFKKYLMIQDYNQPYNELSYKRLREIY